MGVISNIGDSVGGIVGDITGTNAAAEAQERAAQQGLAVSQEQFEQTQANLAPFMQFGTGLLPQLEGALTPIDRSAELEAYYQGPEFQQMSQAARGQQLAASEATGGLGSTATGNALSSIAPQLGQNYLATREAQQADLFNRLMAGTNLGLGAATGTGAAGQQYASQAANLLGQQGAAQAGAAMAPFQTLLGLGQLGVSAYSGGMF